jgi:hypothetical protein
MVSVGSLKHTPVCDRTGMVFVLGIAISLTCDGKVSFSRLDNDVSNKITYALAILLCYWAWLKQDVYWDISSKEQYERVKDAESTFYT